VAGRSAGRAGKVANGSALSDCITVLEGEAAELGR
jgi:hypothetical protein